MEFARQVKNSKGRGKGKFTKNDICSLLDRYCIEHKKSESKGKLIEKYLEFFDEDELQIMEKNENQLFDPFRQEKISEKYAVWISDVCHNFGIFHLSTIFFNCIHGGKKYHPITGKPLNKKSIQKIKKIEENNEKIEIKVGDFVVEVGVLFSIKKFFLFLLNHIFQTNFRNLEEYIQGYFQQIDFKYENPDFECNLTDFFGEKICVIDIFEFDYKLEPIDPDLKSFQNLSKCQVGENYSGNGPF